MPTYQIAGLGWVPDLPDRRDKSFRRAVNHHDAQDSGVSTGQETVQAAEAPAKKPAAAQRAVPSASKATDRPIRTWEGWRVCSHKGVDEIFAWSDPQKKRERHPAESETFTLRAKRFDGAFRAAFGEREKFLARRNALKPRSRDAQAHADAQLDRREYPDAILLKRPPDVDDPDDGGAAGPGEDGLPGHIDLRPFMSPIENQESIGSCTAHAAIGLVEYLQIATQHQYIDAARMFLYKTTRDLLEWPGDTGAYIRETIKSMALFGVCPERYLPYDVSAFNAEPSAFCYSFAANYKALSYYRLENLREIRRTLVQGYPVALGFTCYESIDNPAVAQTGIIPYPVLSERAVGGHAVLAVGYIDKPDWYGEGVLIIRNSWGTTWGQDGYGFLPYSYIAGNHTSRTPASEDYWTMTGMGFTTLPDAQVAPYALGQFPRLTGVAGKPPIVRRAARRRPAAESRSGGSGFAGGTPVFRGGNPVFQSASDALPPPQGSGEAEDPPLTDPQFEGLRDQLSADLVPPRDPRADQPAGAARRKTGKGGGRRGATGKAKGPRRRGGGGKK